MTKNSYMDKPFYFSLIALLSIAFYNLIEVIGDIGQMSLGGLPMLLGDFTLYSLLLPMSYFIQGAIFFGYRFKEVYYYPLAATALTAFVTFLIWNFSIGYMIDPVGYISTKGNIWNSKEFDSSRQKIMSELICCGINYQESINTTICPQQKEWSCARAIALHKGKIYRGMAYSQFTHCFLNIITTIILWAVHLTGGINETPDFDKKRPITDNYSQV